MKWIFILSNLAAAVGIVYAGAIVCYIHEVHSYSTFVELKDRGLLAPSKPQANAPSSDPGGVEERLKSIGGLGSKLPPLTYAAAVFLLNAIAFFFGCQKRPGPARPPPS